MATVEVGSKTVSPIHCALLMPRGWFLREWDGYVLLVSKPESAQPKQLAEVDASDKALEQ